MERDGKGVQRGSRRSASPEREVQAITNKSRHQPGACRHYYELECRVSATVTRQGGKGRLGHAE
jgi:hypothetical protein